MVPTLTYPGTELLVYYGDNYAKDLGIRKQTTKPTEKQSTPASSSTMEKMLQQIRREPRSTECAHNRIHEIKILILIMLDLTLHL